MKGNSRRRAAPQRAGVGGTGDRACPAGGTRASRPATKPAPTPSATDWRGCCAVEPVFFVPGLGFTQLEAKFDRGIGMLLRATLPTVRRCRSGDDRGARHADPPRCRGRHHGRSLHAPGAMPRFRDLLEQRLDRLARRMAEAELDAPAFLGVLLEASAYAADRGLGLYEAVDVVVLGVAASEPPGLRLVAPDRKRLDRDLRRRLERRPGRPRNRGCWRGCSGAASPSRAEDAGGWSPLAWEQRCHPAARTDAGGARRHEREPGMSSAGARPWRPDLVAATVHGRGSQRLAAGDRAAADGDPGAQSRARLGARRAGEADRGDAPERARRRGAQIWNPAFMT